MRIVSRMVRTVNLRTSIRRRQNDGACIPKLQSRDNGECIFLMRFWNYISR
ncbi:hypothetical protein RchiOBHm_Chr7g0183981 [Rosa chinensis]|uniref:Uncharacterized protein n=1 Tax=Rosa chinensis TaxID=74649 RepID=A0A2P6P3D4_ROSCH|nr:hypothetical protein RchiOBHm_Chr7g0183981 [Rosa chinensis]